MAFRTEEVNGFKKSKEWITILHCVILSGEKFTLLVIGKYSKPRWFKNILNLPVLYRASKNSWMIADIFSEFLRSFDSRMQNQSRKVALILDHCRTLYTNINLTNVELFYLPPNILVEKSFQTIVFFMIKYEIIYIFESGWFLLF